MKTYTQRVEELEQEGLTTSDAQAVLDTEHQTKKHIGRIVAGAYEDMQEVRISTMNRIKVMCM